VDDIRCGAGILSAASAFDTGTAVVIDRGRVIAVGTGESPSEVVERAGGFRRGDRRSGAVVIAPSERLDEALLHAVDRCKLQGVGVPRGSAAASISAGVIRLADSLGIFIAEVGNPSRDGAHGRV
jgi:DUF1009 family protein